MKTLAPSLARFEEAVETIGQRAVRASLALERFQIAHEVIGGLAVAAWVARADPDAVRATRDVDLVIRRSDLDRARAALEEAGFIFRQVLGIAMFLDKEKPRVKGGVHLVFENEKVRREYAHAVPPIVDSPTRSTEGLPIAPLEALVLMKLTSYGLKDQVHLQDLLDVGLITPEIEAGLPDDLRERLRLVKESLR